MQDGLSKIEQAILRLATPLENYGTLTEAFEAIACAREYQTKDWPEVATTDAGGRTHEEWIILVSRYARKLEDVYSESPNTPEGRARMLKYAAIQANLALWLVQSYAGEVADDKRIAEGIQAIAAAAQNGGTVEFQATTDGCRFHTSPEPGPARVENDGYGAPYSMNGA